jgi:hypothetical protein
VRVEVYGEQVKAQETIVRAWAAAWDGYAKKIEAERLKIGVYEVESRIFGERVRAYQVASEAATGRAGVSVQRAALSVDVSRIDAQRYAADAGLEATKVSAYDAYNRAQGVRVEAAGVNMQRYATQVQSEIGRAGAWAAGYDGYAKLGAMESAKAQALGAYAQAYQSRVGAFASLVQGESSRVGALTEAEKIKVDIYRADVARFGAELQGEASRIGSLASIYGAEASVYGAEIQGEAASVNAQAQAYTVGIQEAELSLRAKVEYEKVRAEFYTATASAQTAVMDAKGRVLAQVGSAAYAAANVTLSHGDTESLGCSTTYSYNMTGE